MLQSCIQRDIYGNMGTRSSAATQARLSQLGGTGTINRPPRKAIW